MVKALATEWGPSGVGVLCLSPLAVTPALALGFKSDPDPEWNPDDGGHPDRSDG